MQPPAAVASPLGGHGKEEGGGDDVRVAATELLGEAQPRRGAFLVAAAAAGHDHGQHPRQHARRQLADPVKSAREEAGGWKVADSAQQAIRELQQKAKAGASERVMRQSGLGEQVSGAGQCLQIVVIEQKGVAVAGRLYIHARVGVFLDDEGESEG